MTLVSKNIPNLINGVSQQPPALRLASQAEAQENGFSDIVDGLKKRPPTQLKNKLKKTLPNGADYLSTAEINRAHFHTYKRSVDEQYTVVTDPVTPKMYVYDIDGKLRYESGVASWDSSGSQIVTNSDDIASYFGTNSIDNTKIAATSVSDYTFYVNKDKVIAKNTSTPSFVRPWEGMFYMKAANYGRQYRVFAQEEGNIEARGAVQTLTAENSNNVVTLQTGTIMEYLTNTQTDPTTTHFAGENGLFRPDSYVNNATVYNATVLTNITRSYIGGNPFCVLSSSTTAFSMHSSDEDGDTALFTHKDATSSFTNLPKSCEDGFVIQVNGDNQKKEDDFYVQYVGQNNQGTWKECPAPSRPNTPEYHEFDTATMPHTLSQNANLSFTFGVPLDSEGNTAWAERKCGDEDTNPFPSFVGSKINDVFFHRNRLGFLSDENVIFSEASSYFNFFRVTVRSLLDSAPIDLAVSQNEVSILKAAVPAQDDLILFSDLTQFTLSADSLLTPSEVIIDQSTKYECDLTSAPVGAGTSVFFTTKSGNYSGVREFFTKDDSENKDAPSITSHVPEYLNGTVRQMIASSNEDMLICLTDTNKDECYVYKWYNSDQERIQSSWSKWTFSKDIAHMFFNNATLTIIFMDGSFEEIDLANSPESIVYQEETKTVISGASGFNQDGMYGYVHTKKGYNSNLSFGSTSSSYLIQAYVHQTSYVGGGVTNPYKVKVRALKTLFSGASDYDNSALPVRIKITNNSTNHVFNKTIVTGSFLSPNYFLVSALEGSNYVDFDCIIDSTLYAAMFNGSYTVEFIYATTTINIQGSSNPVLLDHRKTLTGLNNQAALLSVYDATANSRYVDHKGNLLDSGIPADDSVLFTYLEGSHTANDTVVNNYVYAGEAYNFKYEFSEQVFKAGDKDPTRMARYQLRSIALNYNDTGSFNVTTASTGRPEKVTNFTGRILGQSDNILGYSPIVEEGTLKVGVQSQAKETTITLNNDSHLPSTFQNAELEAYVTLRNKRI